MKNLKIELFGSKIDDLNNKSTWKTLSEKELLEASKKYTLEIKEGDGCKIEFLVCSDTNKAVSALITDEGEEREQLDIDNTIFAYEDFNAFLNS